MAETGQGQEQGQVQPTAGQRVLRCECFVVCDGIDRHQGHVDLRGVGRSVITPASLPVEQTLHLAIKLAFSPLRGGEQLRLGLVVAGPGGTSIIQRYVGVRSPKAATQSTDEISIMVALPLPVTLTEAGRHTVSLNLAQRTIALTRFWVRAPGEARPGDQDGQDILLDDVPVVAD